MHSSIGVNTLSRYLGTVDSYYGTTFLFKEDFWKEQLECGNGEDIIGKIQNYLMEASNTIQLQIAEAMLSYKEKRLLEKLSRIKITQMREHIFGDRLIHVY